MTEKEGIKKCRVCGKKIKTKVENDRHKKSHTTVIDSDDGVFFTFKEEGNEFHGGVWFCNECWEIVSKKETFINRRFL